MCSLPDRAGHAGVRQTCPRFGSADQARRVAALHAVVNSSCEEQGGDLMEKTLKGKKVAILVANGFEQVELTEPKKALEDAGAITEIVSPAENEVQGWNHDEKADAFPVDM